MLDLENDLGEVSEQPATLEKMAKAASIASGNREQRIRAIPSKEVREKREIREEQVKLSRAGRVETIISNNQRLWRSKDSFNRRHPFHIGEKIKEFKCLGTRARADSGEGASIFLL